MDGTTEISLRELFAAIESPAFETLVSPESSLRRILKLLDSSKEVKRLSRLIRDDSGVAEIVLSRMTRVAGMSVDFRFRHPRDIALAAYLYAIVISSPALLLLACRIVLTAQNTWLSSQIVRLVVSGWTNSSSVTNQTANLPAEAHSPASWINVEPRERITDAIQIAPTVSGGMVFPVDLLDVALKNEHVHSTHESMKTVKDESRGAEVNTSVPGSLRTSTTRQKSTGGAR